MTKIEIKVDGSLEDLATALAEGDHYLGDVATQAGAALISWPGRDCQWFVPHPQGLQGEN